MKQLETNTASLRKSEEEFNLVQAEKRGLESKLALLEQQISNLKVQHDLEKDALSKQIED